MQTAKEKVKDVASAAKEKVKGATAKTEGKAEEATARSKEEKEMAHERTKAKESQAKADLHQEKAEHREDAAAGRIHSVPLSGPHHHRPVGTTTDANPTYPASGGHPAGGKYL